MPAGMTAPDGKPVNAAFGLTAMLLKFIDTYKPQALAACFDSIEPTFREEIYPDYKAQRPPPPEDFAPQVPIFKEIFKAFDIPLYEAPGYEADDLLGTLAKQAASQGYRALIVTGDRDAYQLIDDDIHILTTRKGISDLWEVNADNMREKWDITPAQVVDLKALMGDSSDNIPGVPGIGEKTALALLKQFKDIDDIYAHLHKVEKESLRQKLQSNEKLARLSYGLAKINTQVPMQVDWQKQKMTVPWEAVYALCKKYAFRSLLPKLYERVKGTLAQSGVTEQAGLFDLALQDAPLTPSPRSSTANPLTPNPSPWGEGPDGYQLLTDPERLKPLLSKLKKGFAFDTECSSVLALYAELAGVSFACEAGKAYYIPVGHQGLNAKQAKGAKACLELLKPLFEDASVPKYAHNAKFDAEVLYHHSITVAGVTFDTMIASYLCDASASHGLKFLAQAELGVTMTEIKELIGSGQKQITFDQLPLEQAVPYACADADITLQLLPIYQKRLKENGVEKLFYDIEMPLSEVLERMEETGVRIDAGYLQKMSKEMEKTLKKLETEIHGLAGEAFNINSTQQLGKILFEKLGIPPVKKTKTGFSTDSGVLEALASKYEIASKVMDFRQVGKLKSTYVDALPSMVHPKTGKIHGGFHQTVAATGRLSSSDPNLQNIPIRSDLGRLIRKAFIPSEKGGAILSADYSQIELRILAHITEDQHLIAAYEQDADIHAITASKIYGVSIDQVTTEQRNHCKAINFGIAYGLGARGLSQSIGVPVKDAQAFIDSYFKTYPGIKVYIESTKKLAHKQGYVETLMGRRSKLSGIESKNPQEVAMAERAAINYPIQGTAADIIKKAMIEIDQELVDKKFHSKMIIQVHDELVFDVAPGETEKLKKLVTEFMSGTLKLKVPLTVNLGVGPNWMEAK